MDLVWGVGGGVGWVGGFLHQRLRLEILLGCNDFGLRIGIRLGLVMGGWAGVLVVYWVLRLEMTRIPIDPMHLELKTVRR